MLRPKSSVLKLEKPLGHYYFSGEAIHGWVKASVPGRIRVDLKGIQSSRGGRTGDFYPSSILMRHEFLHMSQGFDVNVNGSPSESTLLHFTFVLPDHLLPYACKHPVSDMSTRTEHLQLPPSLGREAAFQILTTVDMAPGVAQVRYTISASQMSCNPEERNSLFRQLSEPILILVLPRRHERPPFVSGDIGNDYFLQRSIEVSKGRFFPGKVGSVILSARQPPSVALLRPVLQNSTHDLQSNESDIPKTFAWLQLIFKPILAASVPPELLALNTELCARTFWYATSHSAVSPQADRASDAEFNCHTETLVLPRRPLDAVSWTALDDNSTFTAHIRVPILLPQHKIFVPSFHSCIMSRSYMLIFTVKIRTGILMTKTVKVKVPLQMHAIDENPPRYS